MVLGYSRWAAAMLIPSRAAPDLMAGWWQLIEGLVAVPRALVWDGEAAVGRWRSGRSELTQDCQAFRRALATKVVISRPADPEAKGLVARWSAMRAVTSREVPEARSHSHCSRKSGRKLQPLPPPVRCGRRRRASGRRLPSAAGAGRRRGVEGRRRSSRRPR